MEGLGLRSVTGTLFIAVARSGLLSLEGNFMYLRFLEILVIVFFCCLMFFFFVVECYFLFQLGRLGDWTVWRRNFAEADEGAV